MAKSSQQTQMTVANRPHAGWLAAWRRRLRELFGVAPTLDLHGLGVKEALAETDRFLRAAHAAGEPVVRIVYGKGNRSAGGRGVLREVIPRWLQNEGKDLVQSVERLPDHTGADGAARVRLHLVDRRRP